MKAKFILNVNFFTVFVNKRATNDVFAEADVLFLIWNTFDVSLALIENR